MPALTWFTVAQGLRAVTHAGPAMAPTSAAAAVHNLRQGALWSNDLLADLTELPDAAVRVAACPTVVVDRRGALNVLAHLATQGPIPVLGSSGRSFAQQTTGLITSAFLMKMLAGCALLWDPYQHCRVLVAPNVVEIGKKLSLDRIDFSRWVALRAGIWGTFFEQAPWLTTHIAAEIAQRPKSTAHMVRLFALFSAIATQCMGPERLTPADVSSVTWIRKQVSYQQLTGVKQSRSRETSESQAKTALRQQFARRVLDEHHLAVLLADPDHLPTEAELNNPDAWFERVGR